MLVPSYLEEAKLLASVSVLIPTYERPESLAATLAGAASQTVADLHVVVSGQGRHRDEDSAVERAMGRVILARGGSVGWHHREVRGIAVQRPRPPPRARRAVRAKDHPYPRKTNPIPASHRGVD
jgi:hypothetical protein